MDQSSFIEQDRKGCGEVKKYGLDQNAPSILITQKSRDYQNPGQLN